MGNFPALFSPGPNNLGMVLMIESEARKPSYLLATKQNKELHALVHSIKWGLPSWSFSTCVLNLL